MKKKFLLAMIIAMLGIIIAECQIKKDDAFSFELSREYRCAEKENANLDAISAKEVSANYAYTEEDTVYVSIYEPHFLIQGIPYLEENDYVLTRHMSDASKVEYPEGVEQRIDSDAGVRVIFETDAEEITVKASYGKVESYPWFSLTGTAGLDIYEGNEEMQWLATVYLDDAQKKNCTKTVALPKKDMSYMTIYLPSYASINDLVIGFPKDSTIKKVDTEFGKPIVFYGSSITQGCSASRPGTTFPAIVSRHLGVDYINWGFSSSCKGEPEMAEMIARTDMSALVMEFDHNVDTPQELEDAYYNFYQTIRENNETIPIVLLSRTSGGISCSMEETKERDAVIQAVYDKALSEGDHHIYFIDGCSLSALEERELLLADGKHPNDLGMKLIADAIIEVLEK